MKIQSFIFKDYRGIREFVEVDVSDTTKPYCLIGDNESGKSTLLQGIVLIGRLFQKHKLTKEELVRIRPLSPSFSGEVHLGATIEMDEDDQQALLDFLPANSPIHNGVYDTFKVSNALRIVFEFEFNKNEHTGATLNLFGDIGDKVYKMPLFLQEGFLSRINLPTFLYYDNFGYEVPRRISFSWRERNKQQRMWQEILNDLLSAGINDGNTYSVSKDIVRFTSTDHDVTQRGRLQKMEACLDEQVAKSWHTITGEKKSFKGFDIERDGDKFKLGVKTKGGTLPISDRSKGFQWFFCFILMTRIRTYRRKDNGVFFLLDEPANHISFGRHSAILDVLLAKDERPNTVPTTTIFSTHSPAMIDVDQANILYCTNSASETAETDIRVDTEHSQNPSHLHLITQSTVLQVCRERMKELKSSDMAKLVGVLYDGTGKALGVASKVEWALRLFT